MRYIVASLCLPCQLAESNIQVSLIAPGYVKTNLSLNAVRGDGAKYGKMVSRAGGDDTGTRWRWRSLS